LSVISIARLSIADRIAATASGDRTGRQEK
jgi:hypothetical protein